jgi:hypothetical protein
MSSKAISAQGSTIWIGSGTSGAKTITNISQAYCADVTSSAHGLLPGDQVTFASVVGMTQINGLTANVIAATTNEFVVNLDTRAFTAYGSAGTATPTSWVQINEIKDFKPAGAKVKDIEVTNLSSVAAEYVPGLVDNGDLSMTVAYVAADPGQAACQAAFVASSTMQFKIIAPNTNTFTFAGYINQWPEVPEGAVNGILMGDFKLRITGAVTFAPT